MFLDGIRYAEAARYVSKLRALAPLMAFIERKLGVSILYKYTDFPLERPDLTELTERAIELQKKGIIIKYGRTSLPCDEPPIKLWHCHINVPNDNWSGGASVADDAHALTAAIAEAVERHIWFTQTDYFDHPVRTTCASVARLGTYVGPEKFTAFSDEQRAVYEDLSLHSDATYLWIRGQSLVTNRPTYIPAQTASAAAGPRTQVVHEPLIREQHTIGLATWPSLQGAQLAGILEVIEREAFMSMWFNQLTLPRISLASLRGKRVSLDTLLDTCARYNFTIHVIPMLTDAPTHAVCAIVEDMSGLAPRFAFGVKSHRSMTRCVEGAILEGLRARRVVMRKREKIQVPDTVEEVGHVDRLLYWSRPEHAAKLEFLVTGPERPHKEALWENDTDEGHLARVLDWCRAKKYECISIDMSSSQSNLTPWSVVMMVLPDLHPTHLTERRKHLGGTRLQEIPKQFGYTPRPSPYTDMPHPYA